MLLKIWASFVVKILIFFIAFLLNLIYLRFELVESAFR